jgi:hypothetical protein
MNRPRAERAASRLAEHLIGLACRSLPGDMRDERYREWVAELPAIAGDPGIRFVLWRAVRALSYAAGTYRSARHLRRAAGTRRNSEVRAASGSAGWASRSRRRRLTMPAAPDGVRPAIAAVLILLCLAVLFASYPPSRSWAYLIVPASVAVEALALVAIVRFVRWVRRGSDRAPHS